MEDQVILFCLGHFQRPFDSNVAASIALSVIRSHQSHFIILSYSFCETNIIIQTIIISTMTSLLLKVHIHTILKAKFTFRNMLPVPSVFRVELVTCPSSCRLSPYSPSQCDSGPGIFPHPLSQFKNSVAV